MPEAETRATPTSDAPAPLLTEHAFTARVHCDAALSVGASAHGLRRVIPISGGTFEGPRIRGVVLPGGADWQLTRADGVLEIDARYTLRADDGCCISIRNRGLVSAEADAARPYVGTVVSFEAPTDSPHHWLNRSIFVGRVALDGGPGSINVRVTVFRLI